MVQKSYFPQGPILETRETVIATRDSLKKADYSKAILRQDRYADGWYFEAQFWTDHGRSHRRLRGGPYPDVKQADVAGSKVAVRHLHRRIRFVKRYWTIRTVSWLSFALSTLFLMFNVSDRMFADTLSFYGVQTTVAGQTRAAASSNLFLVLGMAGYAFFFVMNWDIFRMMWRDRRGKTHAE